MVVNFFVFSFPEHLFCRLPASDEFGEFSEAIFQNTLIALYDWVSAKKNVENDKFENG